IRISRGDIANHGIKSIRQQALNNLIYSESPMMRIDSIALHIVCPVVYLSYNRLVEIPESLAKCTRLDEFNVENNQLSALPVSTDAQVFWTLEFPPIAVAVLFTFSLPFYRPLFIWIFFVYLVKLM
ncbi:hypothetical protein ACTXT7_016643, partial [Hymenolepis weldensis]